MAPLQPFKFDWSDTLGASYLDRGTSEYRQPEESSSLTDRLQTPLPGVSFDVIESMKSSGFDTISLLSDPSRTASQLRSHEMSQPDAPREEVKFLGEGTGKYLGRRFEQGLGQSSINHQLGWKGGVLGGIADRADFLSQVRERRSQLPNPDDTTEVGWLLDQIGMASELIGTTTRTLAKGAEWGLAGASAGVAIAPLAPVTAGVGGAIGATAGVLTRAAQENAGSLYIQLVEKPYEMYPDLDNPGQYLSADDFAIKRRTDERYNSAVYSVEEVDVPDSIARPIALGMGTAMGALELVQVGWFAKILGGSKIAQHIGSQAARRMIANGTLRNYVANKMVQAVGLAAAETATEIAQEAVGYIGARLTSELSAVLQNRHDVSEEAKEEFFSGLAQVMVNTGKEVGPAMLILGGTAGVGGATVEYSLGRAAARSETNRARLKADGRTDGWFNQEKGEDVSIANIVVEEGEILDRDRVAAAAVLEIVQSTGARLDPVSLEIRSDGSLFAEDPTSAAMTKVMRDAGVLSLRAVKVDRTRGPADSKQASEVFSAAPIEAEISSQFPEDTVAEVKAKALFLQLAASRDGLSLPQGVEAYFQEGRLFPKVAEPDTAIEPGVTDLPAIPTIDGALWNSPQAPAETPEVERAEGLAEPQMPGPPVVEGDAAVAHPDAPPPPGATDVVSEPIAPPAPAVGGRQAMAMGRVLDMLDFGWQAGEWKTPAKWLEDSGMTGLVDPRDLAAQLGTEAAVPADAYAFALRRTMEEGPVTPSEAIAPDVAEEIDEPAEEAFAAIQTKKMRAVEGMLESVGATMSSKTYLASVEAEALEAADELLAKAVQNVTMDRYETTDGGFRTSAEHAALLLPLVEEERSRLESEDGRLRRSNSRELMKQEARDRRAAILAADLAPDDAEAPDITEVEDPNIWATPFQEGTVPRTEITPAFDSRIPAEAPAIIYIDMDDDAVILSGIAAYNSAASTPDQAVPATILRADDGVTLDEAMEYAMRRSEQPDVPESDPGTEVVPIRSDGELVGAVEFDENSKALLRAYDGFDFKSWVHGMSNVFRRMLPPREESIAARWAGAKYSIAPDGQVRWTWDEASNYRLGSGFMKYLEEGRISVPELRPIFKRLSDWTKASYAGNRTRLNSRIRKVYEGMLVDEKSPSLSTYQSNIGLVGQVSDMIFRSPVSSSLLRLKASGGRDLTEEGLTEGEPLVFVEKMNPDGDISFTREYKDVQSAVRDISGVPSSDNPATIGDASYRPFRAKRGAVSGFYGRGPVADPLPIPAGTPETVYVGGKAVDGGDLVRNVVAQLEVADPLPMREGALAGVVASFRRYDYATELLASGVEGQLFQVLSRDIDTGRATEKRTRFDLNDIQREKLVQRGWTAKQLRSLPGRMKKSVEVSGWKHKKEKKSWTVGELLSFNRHLRSGQNRSTLLERGMRDGPDGALIRIDEEDIKVLARAYRDISSDMRELGNEVVDELMDVIHERVDPVVRKVRRRGLGYVPYYWDLERAPQDRPDNIADELAEADALDLWRTKGDAKLNVFEGMTQHRTRKSAPIVLRPLDFQLMRNIDWASMYTGFALPLKAAHLLFNNPRSRAAMEGRIGKDAVQGLEKGLEGVARRWVDEEIIDKTLQSLQRKVTVATLGGNVPVWIKQTLSLPLYATYIPPKYVTASLARSVIPGQYAEMRKNLRAFDPTFMARSKGFDISLQDTLEKSAAGEAWGKRRVSELFMKMITFFDQRTVVVGSHAAYLQAIDQFRTGKIGEELQRATQVETYAEARSLTSDELAGLAYQYANWVTVRSQPNFLPEHVSSFQRGRISRFLSMYSGYTNVAYNMLLRTRYRARQARSPEAIASMRKAFFWILVGNFSGVAMIDYLKQLWLGRPPSEEEMPSWLMDKAISNAASLLYFVRDAVFALQNEWADYSPSPIVSASKDILEAISSVWEDLIERGEVRDSTVKKTLNAAGYVTGWPLGAMQRYGEATYELFDPIIN